MTYSTMLNTAITNGTLDRSVVAVFSALSDSRLMAAYELVYEIDPSNMTRENIVAELAMDCPLTDAVTITDNV